VAWCNVLSEYFLATNGVKQGGVLSHVLFCIYIDNLLLELLKSGFGCYIGNTFVGALAYADDIVLVASSASAMRRLLSTGWLRIKYPIGEYAISPQPVV